MLLGVALMLLGAGVLLAMRHSLWPWREPEELPEIPVVHHDDQAIYVPSERGTVYVSDRYANTLDE